MSLCWRARTPDLESGASGGRILPHLSNDLPFTAAAMLREEPNGGESKVLLIVSFAGVEMPVHIGNQVCMIAVHFCLEIGHRDLDLPFFIGLSLLAA